MGQTASAPDRTELFCKEISHIIEILPARLYFATLLKKTGRIRSSPRIDYFCIDNELVYEGFNNDFGPLNLAMLYRYCSILKGKLKRSAGKIVHYTSPDPEKRANAGYLIGSYAIIYLSKSPEEIYECLTKSTPNSPPFASFRDVAQGPPNFLLTHLDLFKAVEKAHFYNFFNFKDFDFKEYEFYQQWKNAGLSWIVPDKLLAFMGPHPMCVENGHPAHGPEEYHSYFKKHNVTGIIRLNRKLYEASCFTDAGFEHYELYFDDGTPPTDEILAKFLDICELTSGVLAVHCEAGIGRTGTLIAAFIMKHYKFTAREAIAWLRICRPGSVMNNQQQWLEKKQDWLWASKASEDCDLTPQIIENPRWPLYSLKKNACLSWIEHLATTSEFCEGCDLGIIGSDSDVNSNAKGDVSEADKSDGITEKNSKPSVPDFEDMDDNSSIENRFYYNPDDGNHLPEVKLREKSSHYEDEFSKFLAKNKKSDSHFYPLRVPGRRPTFLYCGNVNTGVKPKEMGTRKRPKGVQCNVEKIAFDSCSIHNPELRRRTFLYCGNVNTGVKPTEKMGVRKRPKGIKCNVERFAFDSYAIHNPDLHISAFSRVRPFRIALRDVYSKPILFLERNSLDCATLLPGFCRLLGLTTGRITIRLPNGSRVGDISHKYKYFKSIYYLTDVNGVNSLSVSDSPNPSNTNTFLEYPVVNEKTGETIGCFRKDIQSRDYRSIEGRSLQDFIMEVPLDLDNNLKYLFSAAAFIIKFLFPGRLVSPTET